jgi:two-component system, OmpR family, sensor histidine kinase KdpD
MKSRSGKIGTVLTRPRSERYLESRISVGVDGDLALPGHEADNRHPAPVDTDRPTAQQEDFSILWHELLSPISLIQAYTSTLLQMDHSIKEEERLQFIQGIDSASKRLVGILENLREITHLEQAEIIRDQTIALHELLRKVLTEMQTQTKKHNLTLHLHAPLPRIRIAPEKIEQVAVNLVTNAVKYSPNGGGIEVDLHFARSAPELAALFRNAPLAKTPCYVISVTDSGVGIPEEDLPHIFEKFYRANNKLVRNLRGAGLGLYICKIIVEAHGGLIWAANLAGGGSVFHLSLPLDMDEHQGW